MTWQEAFFTYQSQEAKDEELNSSLCRKLFDAPFLEEVEETGRMLARIAGSITAYVLIIVRRKSWKGGGRARRGLRAL